MDELLKNPAVHEALLYAAGTGAALLLALLGKLLHKLVKSTVTPLDDELLDAAEKGIKDAENK